MPDSNTTDSKGRQTDERFGVQSGHLPELLIGRAEAEASQVFRAMDIQVLWEKCGDEWDR